MKKKKILCTVLTSYKCPMALKNSLRVMTTGSLSTPMTSILTPEPMAPAWVEEQRGKEGGGVGGGEEERERERKGKGSDKWRGEQGKRW